MYDGTAISLEGMAEKLLTVLDEDIGHLENTISTLNELRSLVIKRDDTGLAKLFEDVEAKVTSHAANESRRQSIRRELADARGYQHAEEVTLSRLEAVLPAETTAQVVHRRTKLQSLVGELRKEYSATVLLMADCSRLNRLLLESIFALNRSGAITYEADGTMRWQSDGGLVICDFK